MLPQLRCFSEMEMASLSAIVLAGGYSSRMGRPKATLMLAGKTLLQHQTEKLWALGISEILVSGWEDCPAGTQYVQDDYPHRGPLSGIHAGLCRIRNASALVLPVDMPLLPAQTLQELAARSTDKPITLLEQDGNPEPLVGIYAAALAPDCARILESGRHSPRQLFALAGIQTVPYTGDPRFLLNCNTPEEFRLLQLLAECTIISLT